MFNHVSYLQYLSVYLLKIKIGKNNIGKDIEHNISEEIWIKLCNDLKNPFAIAEYHIGFRLFTSEKLFNNYIAVGVNTKIIGRDLKVNSISTVFGYNQRYHGHEKILYKSKKITFEQAALLDMPNAMSLPSDQRSNAEQNVQLT